MGLKPSPFGTHSNLFAWLDGRSAVTFLVVLIAGRYAIVYPLGMLQVKLAKALPYPVDVTLETGALATFLLAFLAAPLIETAFECALPYAVLLRWQAERRTRARYFVLISAGLLTALHLAIHRLSWVLLIPSTFVTGFFLAYCYAHFAEKSQPKAYAWTSLMHALINVAPFCWTLFFTDNIQGD